MSDTNHDMFSFGAFDPFRLTEGVRGFAGTAFSSAQSQTDDKPPGDRCRDEKMKDAAQEAMQAYDDAVASVRSGSAELSLKAIDALRANADMSLSHLQALFSVKSLAEFMEIQTSFLRRQAQAGLEQAMGMQESARKLAEDMAGPARKVAEKAFTGFTRS